MYRVRSVIKIRTTEGWNEAITNAARINEVAKSRGWQQATVWTQTFGPFGEISIETEYPDLATYERETAEFYADQEAMKLSLETVKHLREDDPGYNEIW